MLNTIKLYDSYLKHLYIQFLLQILTKRFFIIKNMDKVSVYYLDPLNFRCP